MCVCVCVCGCACGGVFFFLNFNFTLYVNVRNDLIKKNIRKKQVFLRSMTSTGLDEHDIHEQLIRKHTFPCSNVQTSLIK